MYKIIDGDAQVLLAHMGGPFWARKDNGAWSIIKGELDNGEDLLTTAKREFAEETGLTAPDVDYRLLGEVKASSKITHVFVGEHDLDTSQIVSNTFEIEWPPKSGQTKTFPEIDRAEWFDLVAAKNKIVKAQSVMICELEKYLVDSGVIKPAVSSEQQTLF